MIDKKLKQYRFVFVACIVVAIAVFIFEALYISKYISPASNPILERWAIIITLAGIFSALKLLHPKLKESDDSNIDLILKKYTTKYYARLMVLAAVFSFNVACWHITGVKNFMYLSFITIFALLLCAPSKLHIEKQD